MDNIEKVRIQARELKQIFDKFLRDLTESEKLEFRSSFHLRPTSSKKCTVVSTMPCAPMRGSDFRPDDLEKKLPKLWEIRMEKDKKKRLALLKGLNFKERKSKNFLEEGAQAALIRQVVLHELHDFAFVASEFALFNFGAKKQVKRPDVFTFHRPNQIGGCITEIESKSGTRIIIDVDSYMLLIEDGEKKILHTGDFRSHGKVGETALNYIKENDIKVDVLIIEGTMLARNTEGVITEEQLADDAKELIANPEYKYIFIMCSSTNIDRIAAFYHANKSINKHKLASKKLFVTDSYQKQVLDVVTENSAEFGDYYDFSESVSFDGKSHYEDMLKNGFCMLVRSNRFSEAFLKKWDFNKNKLFIYSMWKGYLKGDTLDKDIYDFVPKDAKGNLEYTYLHTSGHATMKAMVKLCELTRPEMIIPIHSEQTDRFKGLDSEYIKGKVRLVENRESVII